jgi:hypothetical protein
MMSSATSFFPAAPSVRALAAAAALLCLAVTASAQDTKTAGTPPQGAPAPSYQPGMLDGVGRWFKDSFRHVARQVESATETFGGLRERAGSAAQDAGEAAKDAAQVARDAADAMAKLPGSRVIDVRERCKVAANGAPDCRTAAESVCKSKGYKTGSSFEIQSAQKCSARTWLSGQADRNACEIESVVTRALCQ